MVGFGILLGEKVYKINRYNLKKDVFNKTDVGL
jgi:hypothetical protein